ncbi:MAG TPA: hypothetical protein VG389_19975 [Myxococcota bacterium]|jgi:hypothetical protein|nr:hypothetical protein [Myxococcota bacterium]
MSSRRAASGATRRSGWSGRAAARVAAAAVVASSIAGAGGCRCGGRAAGDAAADAGASAPDATSPDAAAPEASAPGDAATALDAGTDAGPAWFACGPSLQCNADVAICVEYHDGLLGDPQPPTYECRPVPPGCESDRTCACVGFGGGSATVCNGYFWMCQDGTEPDTVECWSQKI